MQSGSDEGGNCRGTTEGQNWGGPTYPLSFLYEGGGGLSLIGLLFSLAEVGGFSKAIGRAGAGGVRFIVSLFPDPAVRGLGGLGLLHDYYVTIETKGNKYQSLCWGHGVNRGHISAPTQNTTPFSLANQ